jgi:uncharacterized protein YceH (UPF0502 family)
LVYLHELDSHPRRVLGALLEKEQTTPDYYPLTLNALIAACNQTSNREPVMNLQRHDVLAAIHALERHQLVQRVIGPRADRWEHLLIHRIYNAPGHKALFTVLLLRGPQTVGELKGRTERMHLFPDLAEVERTLQALAEHDPPLVRRLPRSPGQKEQRWNLNLPVGESEEPADGEDVPLEPRELRGTFPDQRIEELEARVTQLEEQVADLMDRVAELMSGPGSA